MRKLSSFNALNIVNSEKWQHIKRKQFFSCCWETTTIGENLTRKPSFTTTLQQINNDLASLRKSFSENQNFRRPAGALRNQYSSVICSKSFVCHSNSKIMARRFKNKNRKFWFSISRKKNWKHQTTDQQCEWLGKIL